MQSHLRSRWYTLIGVTMIVGGGLLAAYPFYPFLAYKLQHLGAAKTQNNPFAENSFVSANENLNTATLPDVADVVSKNISTSGTSTKTTATKPKNKLIIKKIGVSMNIVEGNASALNYGAWRLPSSKTPDQIGNTIISGHRYQYLPPSSKTFYLLNYLNIGGTFTIEWNGKIYTYGVDYKAVKSPNDPKLLLDSFDRRVTLITCDPLFSTKNRLIVSGQLLKN